jgi:hypothetical protein
MVHRRPERETGEREMATAPTTEQTEASAGSPGGVRRLIPGILVVVASVLLLVGAVATWVDRTALETATWTDVSTKVLLEKNRFV